MKFLQKIFENWRFWKTQFFWISHFGPFFGFMFTWFPANSLLCVIFRYTVYMYTKKLFAIIYKCWFYKLQEAEEDVESTAPHATANGSIAQIDECGVPILSRTPSVRPISRSGHSSFRSSFRANSLEPVEPGVPMAPHAGPMGQQLQTTRLHSFKRNRPSFIHVTAEALSRQKSQRLHSRDSAPWEYQNTITGWEYLFVNLVLKITLLPTQPTYLEINTTNNFTRKILYQI